MKRNVSVHRHLRRKPETAIRRADLTAESRKMIRERHTLIPGRLTGRAGEAAVKRSVAGDDYIDWRFEPLISRFVLNEKIADNLNTLLGWGIVPPTELRVLKKRRGRGVAERTASVSMQQFVDAVDWGDVEESVREELVDKDELIKLVLFDTILGQSDRHEANVVVEDNGKVWAIDNERMLWHDMGLVAEAGAYGLEAGETYDVAGYDIPENLRQDLRDLDKGDFYAALSGQPIEVIDGAWKRKTLLEKFNVVPTQREWRDAALEEYGEDETYKGILQKRQRGGQDV